MSEEDADFARDAADFAAHASALRLGLFHLMEESPTAGRSASHFADSSHSMGSSTHSSYGATSGWGDVTSGKLPGPAASAVAGGGTPGMESGGLGMPPANGMPSMVPLGRGGAGSSGLGGGGGGGASRVSAAGTSGTVGLSWSDRSAAGTTASTGAAASGHARKGPGSATAGGLSSSVATSAGASGAATASGRAGVAVSGSSSAGTAGVRRVRSGVAGSGSGSGSGSSSSGATVLGVKVGGLWVPTVALAASGVAASHIAPPSFAAGLGTGGVNAASGGVAAAGAAAKRPAWGSGSSHGESDPCAWADAVDRS